MRFYHFFGDNGMDGLLVNLRSALAEPVGLKLRFRGFRPCFLQKSARKPTETRPNRSFENDLLLELLNLCLRGSKNMCYSLMLTACHLENRLHSSKIDGISRQMQRIYCLTLISLDCSSKNAQTPHILLPECSFLTIAAVT